MKATYKPNRREFARFMKSRDVARPLKAVAESGRSFAESVAPVASGEYKRSFYVDTRVVGDRQQAILANRAAHATIVEVHLGERVLGRAVDAMESS